MGDSLPAQKGKVKVVARPEKKGLDYFPLDTDMDDKLYSIEVEFGLIGYAIVIKLFQKIYKEGYYIFFNDKQVAIFCKRNYTETDVFGKVLEACLNEGIFQREFYKKYQILTSRGIQKRYFEASRRKKTLYVLPEVTLIDVSTYTNLVTVNINGETKTSKTKTSKTKTKREYKYKTLEEALNDKDLKEKLLKISPEVDWSFEVRQMRSWVIGKPPIINWVRFVGGWIGRARSKKALEVPYHKDVDTKKLVGG